MQNIGASGSAATKGRGRLSRALARRLLLAAACVTLKLGTVIAAAARSEISTHLFPQTIMEIMTTARTGRRLGCSRLGAAIRLSLCLTCVPAAAADAASLEYSVTAFASPGSPVNLCVLGDDPFGASLDDAANGRKIDERAISNRRLKSYTRDAACHILHIGDVKTQRPSQVVDLVRGSSVLKVTDEHVQGTGAGIIHFVVRDGRVRFNIDDEMAAQNGLAISSKLMSLALDVKRRPPREPSK